MHEAQHSQTQVVCSGIDVSDLLGEQFKIPASRLPRRQAEDPSQCRARSAGEQRHLARFLRCGDLNTSRQETGVNIESLRLTSTFSHSGLYKVEFAGPCRLLSMSGLVLRWWRSPSSRRHESWMSGLASRAVVRVTSFRLPALHGGM